MLLQSLISLFSVSKVQQNEEKGIFTPVVPTDLLLTDCRATAMFQDSNTNFQPVLQEGWQLVGVMVWKKMRIKRISWTVWGLPEEPEEPEEPSYMSSACLAPPSQSQRAHKGQMFQYGNIWLLCNQRSNSYPPRLHIVLRGQRSGGEWGRLETSDQGGNLTSSHRYASVCVNTVNTDIEIYKEGN